MSSPCYWCPWYVSNRLIHEDLGIPLFADHIRALNAIFDSKLADVGNPLLRQIGRYLGWPRVDPFAWRVSEGRQGPAGQSRPSPAMAKSTKTNRVQRWSAERLSSTLTVVFRDFFSVVRQMPENRMQSRGTARTSFHQAPRLNLSAWKSRKPVVCDWAILGSEPRQPTKQCLSLP